MSVRGRVLRKRRLLDQAGFLRPYEREPKHALRFQERRPCLRDAGLRLHHAVRGEVLQHTRSREVRELRRLPEFVECSYELQLVAEQRAVRLARVFEMLEVLRSEIFERDV